VATHCQLLRCGPEDAVSHLMAALGYISTHLEHFPLDEFSRMADSCLEYVTIAGAG